MEDTGLRDRLAVERTVLANERTMLSWVRTGLGLGFAGATFLKLFPEDATYAPFAWGMLVSGVAVGVFGVTIYFVRRRRYRL